MTGLRERLHNQSSKKLALLAARLRETGPQSFASEPVAVIGIGCRFPGTVTGPEQFWEFLQQGGNGIIDIPPERWDVDRYYDPDPTIPGKSYSRQGGFLDKVDQFDAGFFSISPREARQMDPRQRLLLETAWEALEHAAHAPATLAGSRTGVFVGHMAGDYHSLLAQAPDLIDSYVSTGVLDSLLANRLSYALNLCGPSLSVDTACSSALTALYLACQNLRQADCDLALVGGVNLMLSPEMQVMGAKAGILSPTGSCSTFSSDADGFVRGEGCGVIVLKRLADALTDNDSILAVVRGVAVNQDGHTNGIAAPNGFSQQRVIRQALKNALLDAAQVTYIETHGTGTLVGDPIELEALTEVYGAPGDSGACFLGAVKTNIGHLEGAAGIAGVIKMVLCLGKGIIPPNINFKEINPHISLEQTRFQLPLQARLWEVADGPRYGAISSFGIGGTNGHIILEQAPQQKLPAQTDERSQHITGLSAQTTPALTALVQRYQDYLTAHPDTDLADLAFSANNGRNHFEHRSAFIASSIEEFREQLQQFKPCAKSSIELAPVKTAFIFTGQGSQYAGMAQELYQTQPLFRHTINYCAQLLSSELQQPLLEVLFPADDRSLINETAYTQPALFAVEYALAQLWFSWGIKPDYVMGHSVGEYVAACIAGVFSLEHGLQLIAARARLMQALPENGAMVAVMTDEAHLQRALEAYIDSVSIAALNGPHNAVLSGEREAVHQIVNRLKKDGVETRPLRVSHAFHSPLMEPMLAGFEQVANTIEYRPPRLDLISNVNGQLARQELTEADYWVRHVREPVRFADGIAALRHYGCNVFIEIGPGSTSIAMGQQCGSAKDDVWVASLQPKHSDWQYLLKSLGKLYERGLGIDWSGFDHDYNRRKLTLPSYPFQRQSFWLEDPAQARRRSGHEALRPLIHKMTRSPLLKETLFETDFSVATLPFLADHRVFDEIVIPGACYLAVVASAAEVLGRSSFQLDDILFPAAMVLDADEVRRVQVLLAPGQTADADGLASVQLASLAGQEYDAEPVTHMMGQLRWQQQSSPPGRTPLLHELQQRCAEVIDPGELYRTSFEQQIVFGPCFQWLQQLWRGNGETLAQLTTPAELNRLNGYCFHPALLDACFQVAAATLLGRHEEDTWLPFMIRSIQVHQAAAGCSWWCHARQVGEHIWNIQLLDEQGQLLLEMIEFQERQAPSEMLLGRRVWEDWLYQVVWQAQEATVNDSEKQHWLIFADTGGIGAQLARQNDSTTLVYVGEGFTQTGSSSYRVNPESASDYQELLKKLPDPFTVVYLWNLDEPDQGADGEVASVAEQLCTRLLTLTQALIAANRAGAGFQVVTRQAQVVSKQDSAAALVQATLWGMGKVIALEHPELHCTMLDLPAESPEAMATALLTELNSANSSAEIRESQLAWRNGQRYLARLIRYPLTQHDGDDNQPTLELKAGATYLITGGTGGIGLEVARSFVEQGAKQLVLLARRSPPDNARQKIEQLQQAGASISVIQTDIADNAQVVRLMADLVKNYPPLKGIVHAAGVLDDGAVQNQSREHFTKVMAPKIQGAWNLHSLTHDIPLDFFVLFSSLTSVLGSMGQANYAAANAFLDALAHYRRSRGLPALSINWGGWSEVGMAAAMTEAERARLTAKGEALITPAQGTEILGHLLTRQQSQIGVFPLQWSDYLDAHTRSEGFFQMVAAGIKTIPESTQETAGGWLQVLQAAPENERYDLLIARLRSLIAELLRLDADSPVELRQGLRDLGLDSIISIELRGRLEIELKSSLPATLLFDYPTLETLADYLSQKVLKLPEKTTTTPEADGQDTSFDVDIANLLSDIDQLSGTEIQQQLTGNR